LQEVWLDYDDTTMCSVKPAQFLTLK